MIYLDNAATTWPKPDCVVNAMTRYMRDVGANPGRSGHRLANEAERVRRSTRESVAALVGLPDPMGIVFTLNATAALNLVLHGLLRPGSHVVVTGMEHNAVMRPLASLGDQGVTVSLAPGTPEGTVAAGAIEACLRPETRLIVAIHGSNVCGTLLPVREIGAVARRHGVPLLVDAAQTVGCVPIDMTADNLTLLAFSGHKGMLGPTGTGGLAIHESFDVGSLAPWVHGGTGSRSAQTRQPDFLPDKFEAGTPNIVGLAGLDAGARFILERGVPAIRDRERRLTRRLIDGLSTVPGVRVLGTGNADLQTAVVSFVVAGRQVSDIALALDERYAIMCRPGLHCAPQAHQTLGTFPEGAVRFSASPHTTEAEVDRAVEAVAALAGGNEGE
jgi:cysteine desulfurase family protein